MFLATEWKHVTDIKWKERELSFHPHVIYGGSTYLIRTLYLNISMSRNLDIIDFQKKASDD